MKNGIVSTPSKFIRAIEIKFGRINFDLCAIPSNAKAKKFFPPEKNSLQQSWRNLCGILWCNPPYQKIEPWIFKALNECGDKNKCIMLIPASVDSNYWQSYIHFKAAVFWVKGRIIFDGHKEKFPKPLALLIYGYAPGYYGQFDWKALL